jgi:lysophospholipase L1-like esterase
MLGGGLGVALSGLVVAFGDSITLGVSGTTSYLAGYAQRVATTKKWEIDNRAVGGSRIADATQITAILKYPFTSAHKVIFLTGFNDMRFTGTDGPGQTTYSNNLETILAYLETTGATVYLGNCLKMTASGYALGSPFNVGSDTAVGQFNAIISARAAAHSNVILIDASAAYNPNTDVSGDNIHPSNSGHANIANAFLAEM